MKCRNYDIFMYLFAALSFSEKINIGFNEQLTFKKCLDCFRNHPFDICVA